MFKDSVFRLSVNTKKWMKAAGIRAIKTMAQVAVVTIGVSTTIGDVNWGVVGSTALLTGIVSVLTSLGGIPEVKADGTSNV